MRARVVVWLGLLQALVFQQSIANADETCNADRTQCCAWWAVQVTSARGPAGMMLEDSFDKLQKRIEDDTESQKKLCKYFGPADDSCTVKYGPAACAMGNQASKCDGVSQAFDEWAAQLQRDLDTVGRLEGPYGQLAKNAENARKNPFKEASSTLADFKKSLQAVKTRVTKAKTIIQRATTQGQALFINPYMKGLGDSGLLALWNTNGEFTGADEKDGARCEMASVAGDVNLARNIGSQVSRIPAPPEIEIKDPIESVSIPRPGKTNVVVVGGWKPGPTPPPSGRYPIAWIDPQGNPHFDVKIETVDGPENRTRIKITAGPANDQTVIYLDGPRPDRDGDGVIDARDGCPDERGLAPSGCPPRCPSNTEWNGSRCEWIARPAVVQAPPPPQPAAPAAVPQANRCASVTIVPDGRPCDEIVMSIFQYQHGASVGCSSFLVHNAKSLSDNETWCVIDKMPAEVQRAAANVKARPQNRGPGNVCQLAGWSAGDGADLWACATLR